ncbi:MAG TPA: SPOR domain-containing protein [Burkholderiaceae bacterium]|nr:SPOR domain-containing protein [Burkholderiaceae bacterium]
MKLAFWGRKRSRRSASEPADAGAERALESAAEEVDAAGAAARVRVRTRRRLVGAFALLLAVVVLVPMLLDSTPHAVSENIPIELPSDKTPFVPRIPPPPPEGAGAQQNAAVVPAAPGSAADTASEAPPADGSPKGKSPEVSSPGKKRVSPTGEAAKSEAKHAAQKSDGSSSGRIFVQAAAMSSEDAAQELVHRLVQSGLAPFIERAETSDGVRFRVRLGPFASRGDAERSRARLRSLGVNSNIVGA